MSDIQMEIAATVDSIFLDGTFSISPKPFYQVVFITGKVEDNVFPIATALLPNKLEATYREVLEKIKGDQSTTTRRSRSISKSKGLGRGAKISRYKWDYRRRVAQFC